MENWEAFEKLCREFLIKTFNLRAEDIVLKGGSDSTSADIEIKIRSGEWINIKAKMPCAQAGQFVVSPSADKFIFSKRNKSEEAWAAEIMQYLDKNYKSFCKLTTAGEDIKLSNSILANWIKKYYGIKKKTKFFITSYNDNMVIFPTEKLEKYFNISACLRIKKSGSTAPTKNNLKELSELLGADEEDIIFRGKGVFVNLNSKEEKFIRKGQKYRYQFTKTDDGSFGIRRLANTNNANIIFRLESKKSQDQEDIDIFRKAILE